MGNFADKLKRGEFVTTVEISPPKGTNISDMLKKSLQIKDLVDAINITDNQRATMHVSPLSASALLLEKGIEPVCQLTCRDRNGLALQSELLSAAVMGIENILIVSGDYPNRGDHPYTKPVYDLDSVQLIKATKKLETGKDLAGNKLNGSPKFFVGGVVNPTATPQNPHRIKLQKKIAAGAQFIQTQVIYDAQAFIDFAQTAPDIPILAGIFPLINLKIAHFMNNKVPGVTVPKTIIKRLEKAKDPAKEAVTISQEIIKEIKPHIAGIHIMAMNNIKLIKQILAVS